MAFFLDGASGAGKTSLGLLVAKEHPEVRFIPRYTTRRRRTHLDEREYVFVDRDEFERLKEAGEFLEHRDYAFGMSYGLPRRPITDALRNGHSALAIINLGRVETVKTACPKAVTILIDVPELTIRERLLARGLHSPEQIEERLRNASTVRDYLAFYDHVLTNSGDIGSTAEQIYQIIKES